MGTARKAVDEIMREVQEKYSPQITLKNHAAKI